MSLSAPGALVVVKHVPPLIALHIVAPSRQFDKQGQTTGSLIVKLLCCYENAAAVGGEIAAF